MLYHEMLLLELGYCRKTVLNTSLFSVLTSLKIPVKGFEPQFESSKHSHCNSPGYCVALIWLRLYPGTIWGRKALRGKSCPTPNALEMRN